MPKHKVDGWIILDKPLGLTSTQAIGRVRRVFSPAKIGHAGTLDPLATGILPIAMGEATKTIPYVMDGAKTYRFTVAWGEARATDDGEGEVVATSLVRPATAELEAALPGFTGEILQAPPAYSAIKIGGERAYDLARAGEVVEIAPRRVRIDRLSLISNDGTGAELEMDCGKGTYVRSLARDLARVLGTVGYVSQLRRTRCGPFTTDHSISLDMLASLEHIPAAPQALLPVQTALDDIPALALTEDEARRLKSGQAIDLRGVPELPAQPEWGAVVRAELDGRLVALVRIEAGVVRPVRVLNL